MIELLNLLHGYPSGSVATKLANDYYQKFRPKELDHVKVLWLHAQGPGLLFTKTKPVNKLEDIKGLKIRGFTCNVKYLSLLGAVPITMPMGDVYDALSKGVADGITGAYETMENWKLADLIRYAMEDYEVAYTSVFLVVMNKQKWDSLPKDIQAIIDSMTAEYIEKSAKMWDKIDESGKQYLINKGGKIIRHSKEEQARWVEKAKPVMEEWTNQAEKNGLPGKEAMKYIQDYLQKHKR
jgi:TRAP-type C4-dicarboxylate transport system substrate-binding protein